MEADGVKSEQWHKQLQKYLDSGAHEKLFHCWLYREGIWNGIDVSCEGAGYPLQYTQ